LDPSRHRLPADEHDRVYQDVVRPRNFSGVVPTDEPTATILGGTPGTGKSSVARELLAINLAAKISSDRVSKLHPKWHQLLRDDDSRAGFYARPDAVSWVSSALEEAAQRRLPVLIDTALADPDRARDISRMFRAQGYSVHFAIVGGPAAFSQIGVLNRHYTDRQIQGGARFVDHPDGLFDGVRSSTRAIESDTLGESITVYRRTAETLYRNELEGAGTWRYAPGAEAALLAERTRPWTAAESQWFVDTATKLASVRPEELGPGLRDRWSELVDEAVSTAIPHLRGEFADAAGQIVSDGQARSSETSAEVNPALREVIERLNAGRRPAAEAPGSPPPTTEQPARLASTVENETGTELSR
jgi:predicted kinase